MTIQQKRYTEKAKITALRLLQKNDYNFLKTEKLTGINRVTLKKWSSQYGNDVFSADSPIEQALQQVDAEMIRNDQKVIQRYFNLRMQILNRIALLVPNETRLDPLINSLKAITDELEWMSDKNETSSGTRDFIKIITDQLKIKKQEGQLP